MVKKTWLRFDEVHDTGKTKIWAVYNAENHSLLGSVKWHGPWRQYVYDTSTANYGVVWNPDCMDELTTFIRARMEERKQAKEEVIFEMTEDHVFIGEELDESGVATWTVD